MKARLLSGGWALTVALTVLLLASAPAQASGSDKTGWYHAPRYYTQGLDEWMYCEDFGALWCYNDFFPQGIYFSSSYPNVVFGG